MMRPLTAFGCITYAPVYIRPSFPGTRPNFPSPVGGRQGRRPSFPSTRPNFAGGRSRLDFLLLLFLCQDKKRRRTGASLSRVKTRRRTGALPLYPRVKTGEGEEQGLCPFTPTFFSSLDGRKEGKRRSRRQGRRPSFPSTWPLGRNYRGQSPLTTAPEWAHNYLRPTGR